MARPRIMPVGCCFAVSLAGLVLLSARDARACSYTDYGPSRAWPPNGSKNVSPATSVFVLGSTKSNDTITLSVNGSDVPLSFSELGGLYGTTATVFRANLPDVLEASSEYVLMGPANYGVQPMADAGAPVELTRFTTAASYDKNPGTPPSIGSLKLWSVRYPLHDIASGNCVFAEYQGYAAIEKQAAQIPNTTPEGMLYTLSITPKTGGGPQTLVFSGDKPFTGHALSADDPYPLSLGAEWFLDLDPRREYCATLSARGDGDNARLPVVSETVCASVTELCAPGADCTKSGDSSGGGSGCSTAPRPLESGAAWLATCAAAIAFAARCRARFRRAHHH